MAAITITANSVVPGSDAVIEHWLAGATITAGQSCYLDSTTNTIKLTDANGAAALRSVYGVALNGGRLASRLPSSVAGRSRLGVRLSAARSTSPGQGPLATLTHRLTSHPAGTRASSAWPHPRASFSCTFSIAAL